MMCRSDSVVIWKRIWQGRPWVINAWARHIDFIRQLILYYHALNANGARETKLKFITRL